MWGPGFLQLFLEKALTVGEKSVAFLLTSVSKKALVVRNVPALETTRRHTNDR